MTALRVCRLPFDFCVRTRNEIMKNRTPPLMMLPNVSNTIHLHTLIIGMNTSRFLERLLPCIPFIKNLSVGVNDKEMNENDDFDIIT